MIKTYKGREYLVTDDLDEITSDKMKKGTRVFFNKDCSPCYTSKKENANDLLTVEHCGYDAIFFKELPNVVFDFHYRRREMYKVIRKLRLSNKQ